MPRGPRRSPDEVRAKILQAFSQRARRVGIRATVTSELAADIGVSKRTVYELFDSKEKLVEAMMARWIGRLVEDDDPITHPESGDVVQGLLAWADGWYRNDAQIGEAFWADLENDYPELHARYIEAIDRRLGPLKRLLSPSMRSDLPQDFMWELYKATIERGIDPQLCEDNGLTRKQGLLAAASIWGLGTVRRRDLSGDLERVAKGSKKVAPKKAAPKKAAKKTATKKTATKRRAAR